ncbi:MAG: hypothetical protein JXX28_19495 [Deltaproteobacteria bacterium]|nr:hypothetical protein [Deltaproteobacteria bacterium]
MWWTLLLACNAPSYDTSFTCDAVALDAEPTWEGHPSDGWSWEKTGALFDTSPVAGDGDLAPTLFPFQGALWMVFSRKVGVEMSLWTAHSQDGASWSEPTPLIGVPDGAAQYAAVAPKEGALWMWVGSGSLDQYRSEDGLRWDLTASGVFRGREGDFDALSVLYPSVIADVVGWRMVYTGFDGATYRVGMATSADGQVWTRGDHLALEAGDGFDNAAVAQPALLAMEHGWWLWYGGYDTSSTNPGPWRVGLARTLDGVFYDRMGVSVPLSEEGADAWSARDPAVAWYDGAWRMVYAGMGTDGVYRLMGARSAVCP